MKHDLVTNGPFGFFAFLDDGSLYDCNATAAQLLGYPISSLLNANVEIILTLSSKIFYQTHFYPLIRMHGHAEEIFMTLLTADQQHLPVLLNAKRIEADGRHITSCGFIVVNNRKKFEDELVNAKKTAEQALAENSMLIESQQQLRQYTEGLDRQLQIVSQQNAELQQFNHVITHSLKEPLRKTLLYASMAEEQNSSPALENMIRSATQMKKLVEGLQQYIWLNEKQNYFQEVNTGDVLKDVISSVNRELQQDLLEISYTDSATIEADREQLKVLFFQILMNSVKFRKGEKAVVRITTTLLKQNKFQQVKDKYEYVEYVKIQITDQGIGFDSSYATHIFDLFRKLTNMDGQGLGLSLCRKIAENHHGKIEADSRPNEFTSITVWLPRHQKN